MLSLPTMLFPLWCWAAQAAELPLGPHVLFTAEDTTWKVAKAPSAEGDRPMYEASLEHPTDPGVSVYLWLQKLKPEEIPFFAQKTPEGRVQFMVDMLSRNNAGPTIAPTALQTTGGLPWARVQITNPSGKVSDNFVAALQKDDYALFLVYSHEPWRSPTQADFQPAPAEAEWVKLLGSVKFR